MTDYKSMFEQAVRTLAAIDEALGIGDDGCADPDQTLTAIAELKAAKAEKVRSGQQLYAKIKRSSKYYGQGEKGALFEVFVEAGHPEAYLVQGGPGGQYRLADVNLYIVDEGREVRIS